MKQATLSDLLGIFDVLVVGAGPAGCSAAFHFRQAGFSTLLVDRKQFPRDKACGDALMPPALDELGHLGVLDAVQRHFHQVSRSATIMGSQKQIHILQDKTGKEASGVVAPRKEFDYLLLQHALQQDCLWFSEVMIRTLDKYPDYVVAQGVYLPHHQPVQVKARLVIVADGSASTLARQVRASSPHSLVFSDPLLEKNAQQFALRGYWRGLAREDDLLEFFFPASRRVHYFWIFPERDGRVNVGVIATQAQARANPSLFPQALFDFLQEELPQSIQEGNWSAAPLATGLWGAALYGDRVLCVGDAAKLVDPLSGEGISGALWSGRMAALVATDLLQKDTLDADALKLYGELITMRFSKLYAQRLQQLEHMQPRRDHG